MSSLDFLKKVEVLKGLDDERLVTVQTCCHEAAYYRNDKLFAEGEEATHLWIVMEGQIDIRFDLPGRPSTVENNISSLSEGMTFGWSGLVPPHKYKLSAYCTSKTCKVMKIEKGCLIKLFDGDETLGYYVMKNMAGIIGNRLNRMQETFMAAPIAGVKVSPLSKVKVTVHMSTCGIAAGAREIMSTLMEEIAQTDRKDIEVETGKCLGKCTCEPNVTIAVGGQSPVVYQHMTSDKMRQAFRKHILRGEVQKEFVMLV